MAHRKSSLYKLKKAIKEDPKEVAVYTLIFAFFLTLFTVIALSVVVEGEASACVVTDKSGEYSHRRSATNIVYTENCGRFQVNANWFAGQFNPEGVYSSIEIGETYNFETRGVESVILARNIVSYEKNRERINRD